MSNIPMNIDNLIQDVKKQQEKVDALRKEVEKSRSKLEKKKQALLTALQAIYGDVYISFDTPHGKRYGRVHSVEGLTAAKVMNIGFYANGKIDNSYCFVLMDDINVVDEKEVKEYVFNSFMEIIEKTK